MSILLFIYTSKYTWYSSRTLAFIGIFYCTKIPYYILTTTTLLLFIYYYCWQVGSVFYTEAQINMHIKMWHLPITADLPKMNKQTNKGNSFGHQHGINQMFVCIKCLLKTLFSYFFNNLRWLYRAFWDWWLVHRNK